MSSSYSLWAQAALAFPTMAVVVIDTTGIQSESDIIRVHVATVTGPIYDQLFWSERHMIANERYTGLDAAVLAAHPAIPEEWEHLRAVLTSHYLLAYSLDFVQERLDENALHYGLQPFALIGDDLQITAVEYFRSIPTERSAYNLSLADACARIGHTMPTPPMAQDRAAGQLALLHAMAAGKSDETPDLTDHPF